MKIKRQKKLTKNISFYVNNFGFRQPYQVLIDGTFCHVALQNKVNIADNIPRYLQSELKLLTTQCAIIETENLGKKVSGALKILKQYKIHKCGHEGTPISAADCLLSMLGTKNEKHYLIATQDRELQEKIRNIPGVPLLYMHLKTPVLEAPSEATQISVKRKMAGIVESEIDKVNTQKLAEGLVQTEETQPKKKKRKKGPNPLSCKKKKKQTGVQKNAINKKKEGITTDKKKGKKIRIPKHIKEELLKKPQ